MKMEVGECETIFNGGEKTQDLDEQVGTRKTLSCLTENWDSTSPRKKS